MMKFQTHFDRFLRHSILARAQPLIRKAPWLHEMLLRARDVVLPFRSRFGLSRYQHRAIEAFFACAPDLSGTVLEIGSDADGLVLRELASRGVRNPIGLNIDVNPAAHTARTASELFRYEIIQGDARTLPFKDCSVSSIFSITAFEHILNFDMALAEMHRVLKPGGIVYSDFGPIWSGSVGHHVYAMADGLEARHFKPGKNPVPHYAHLWMTREEMRSAVQQETWVTPALAEAIVYQIYDGTLINRLFYEDYIKLFYTSPLTVRKLEPVRDHVSRRLQERLKTYCQGYTDFSVRMVEVVLQKS
jgi:SAM-dependent methyltransferase